MKIKTPVFIVIEGVDGSGKSTQIEMLKTKFKNAELKVWDTFEPTDGPIGMITRNIMKDRILTDQSALAALFCADRLDHIMNPVNGMKKRREEGFNIICSRYYFSNYAFQSEYVPIDWLSNINSLCKSYMQPDLIIYLNVDPIKCYTRINENRGDLEMYENESKTIKAHEAYLKYLKQFGQDENIVLVDGNQNQEQIAEVIWKNTLQVLESKELIIEK